MLPGSRCRAAAPHSTALHAWHGLQLRICCMGLAWSLRKPHAAVTEACVLTQGVLLLDEWLTLAASPLTAQTGCGSCIGCAADTQGASSRSSMRRRLTLPGVAVITTVHSHHAYDHHMQHLTSSTGISPAAAACAAGFWVRIAPALPVYSKALNPWNVYLSESKVRQWILTLRHHSLSH